MLWNFCMFFFLIHQVLGIVGSRIEIERIFNIIGVITNLKWTRLEIENLNRLILIMKNWLSDNCVGCDGPLKFKFMVKFLEKDFIMIEKHIRLIEE